MNKNTFERIVEDSLDMCKAVLERKQKEYSSNEDKLHNFVEAAKLMRCKTKEYALFGMLNKHLVSVIDMIVKYEQKGILPDENMVEEKIGDSINYFVLLKACFLEDIYNNENSCDKESGWTINKLHEHRKTIEKIDKGNLCEFCAKNESTCVIKSTVGKTHKIEECEGFVDFKKQEAAKVNSNGNEDIEYLKKMQAAMANSLYTNPRKHLVVETLKKKLKQIIEWLTITKNVHSMILVDIFNRVLTEEDSVGDDRFIDELVAELKQIDLPDSFEIVCFCGTKTLCDLRNFVVKELEEQKEKDKTFHKWYDFHFKKGA